MKTLQLIVAVATLCMLVTCLENGDGSQMTSSNELRGKNLLILGRQYDEELLRLLRKSINNLEKKLSKAAVDCKQWSDWSRYTVSKPGQLGLRVRTRDCYIDITKSKRLDNDKTSTDFKACEGFCPDAYILTKHGFCLKFVSTKALQPVAKSACMSDGGYLVHMNSPEKIDDIVVVAQHTKSKHHWMDGGRTNFRSSWYYSYERHLEWSLRWDVAEKQTSKQSGENCLTFKLDKTKHDSSLNAIYKCPYVC